MRWEVKKAGSKMDEVDAAIVANLLKRSCSKLKRLQHAAGRLVCACVEGMSPLWASMTILLRTSYMPKIDRMKSKTLSHEFH